MGLFWGAFTGVEVVFFFNLQVLCQERQLLFTDSLPLSHFLCSLFQTLGMEKQSYDAPSLTLQPSKHTQDQRGAAGLLQLVSIAFL